MDLPMKRMIKVAMPAISSKHVYSGMASIKNVLQILLINSENMFLMVKLYNEQ